MRLSASDSQLSASDEVQITVDPAPPGNQAPVVAAGVDQSVTLPASATLEGAASDDGLPSPPAALTTTWSQVSGPGTVTFQNPSSLSTAASFSAAGVYLLRLSASDSQLSASDEVQITVASAGGSSTLNVPVSIVSDDAEENNANGVVDLASSDLELVVDKTLVQTVGLRFTGMTIPAGASITNAYVQFTVDEPKSAAASLTVRGERSLNPPTYTAAAFNVTSRPDTAASVAWSPSAWTPVGAAGVAQRTPNLSAIVQEIVSQAGWSPGNAIALTIAGTGVRTAAAFNGGPPAILHVDYASGGGGPVNQAPVVAAGVDQSVTLPASATLEGAASDDGLPSPPAALTTTWSQVSGPGTVTFQNPSSLSTAASFSAAGVYLLRLSASDSQLSASDEVQITVASAGGSSTLNVPVSIVSDDAEENNANGVVDLASSDLELVVDKTLVQTVGLRFTGMTIPAGASITNAYVQFTVDEPKSAAASLTVRGERSLNPPTYTAAAFNVTSRPDTAASVAWSPSAWTPVGAAGVAQRTPNLSAIVQEIVSQAGWSPGNAIALTIAGTGVRTAAAFNGGPPAILHVELTAP